MNEDISKEDIKKKLGLDKDTKMISFEYKNNPYDLASGLEWRKKQYKKWTYLEVEFDCYINAYHDDCKIRNIKSVDHKYNLNHDYPIYISYDLIYNSKIIDVKPYTIVKDFRLDDENEEYLIFSIYIPYFDKNFEIQVKNSRDKEQIEYDLNTEISKIEEE
jgi:hypothetical protein